MTPQPVVVSTHALHPDATRALRDATELRVASGLDPATLIRECADASIVIVRAPLPPALFGAATPVLRAAIRHGAGVDMIPLDAATEAGVLVANLPGVNAASVAEYVVFAMLALLRRYRMIDRDLRTRNWLAGRAHAEHAQELAGRALGIVGPGHIGRALQAIAGGGFGMRVLAHGRNPERLAPGMLWRSLEDLLSEADFVALCCPLTDETRGLINRDRLALMRPSAFLINVARGAVVDEVALTEALIARRIAGAALDVFATQPLPSDHLLLQLDTVILTPHLAGITDSSMQRMGIGAAEEALRVLAGGLPLNLVNPAAVERYRQRW